jgi:hypothetical protein
VHVNFRDDIKRGHASLLWAGVDGVEPVDAIIASGVA